jgi:hypothetical protein
VKALRQRQRFGGVALLAAAGLVCLGVLLRDTSGTGAVVGVACLGYGVWFAVAGLWLIAARNPFRR